ncbi:MAG: T9SS type A sorting domain-containing protein [Saprospiraceae bacterium]|nr:T9SS type A sorting domain-containing protein [Saprospiraceae bacterium]
MDWLCEDDTPCGRLVYNGWLYDLIKYATVTCKSNGYLDDHKFDELFYRAVGNPQQGDMVRIKNKDFINLIDTALGGFIRDSLLMGKDIIELDSTGFLGLSYGVDVFKCRESSSEVCVGLGGGFEELFLQIFIKLYLDNCVSLFGLGPDIDLFIPAIFPEQTKRDLFSQWKEIGGGWSDAVPFSCEDACEPVTVEILVMDYWCNWSKAWTNVWVEDKTPIQVVKDVVEQEVITCKVYKENNYNYPGELHPVSIEYIVDQAKSGQQAGFDALDGIFGGYCKAWVDPYGNYVDAVGNEIECDLPFYDSICYCTSEWKQVRVYDDHLGYQWVDSLVTTCYYEPDTLNFQKGIVAVNCAQNVYCEQEVWCDFDHCGQGYIFRKFKIWSSCAEATADDASYRPDSLRHPVDTIYRHQRIWVGNECELNKYMFDVPGDTEVFTCQIEYGPDGNVIGDAGPENTGYATYRFDDDCRIVGIAHEDKVFKIVGGDAACYKILRTWYFADWCNYGGDVPSGKWWLDAGIVVDKCVQKIIVTDTVPPVCLITGPVADGDTVVLGACEYTLNVQVDATDACGLIAYYWELKDITDANGHYTVESGSEDLSGDAEENFGISIEDLLPGTYKLKVQVQDECTNEGYCEYTITVNSGKKPTPVCITTLTARLTPWDSDNDGEVDSAHAVVWAYEFDRSSTPACGDDSLEYRIEFITDIEDDLNAAGDLDYLEVGCSDIGTRLVRVWIVSHPGNTRDYCDAVLVVQSDLSECELNGNDVSTPMSNYLPSNQVSAEANRGGQFLEEKIGMNRQAMIEGSFDFPGNFELYQNKPNPFRTLTSIDFYTQNATSVSLTIFDIHGRILKRVEGDFDQGYQSFAIREHDLNTNASVLYYQVETEQYSATRKMIIIR